MIIVLPTSLFIVIAIILIVIVIFTMACIVVIVQVHNDQKRVLKEGKDEGELTGDQMLEQ